VCKLKNCAVQLILSNAPFVSFYYCWEVLQSPGKSFVSPNCLRCLRYPRTYYLAGPRLVLRDNNLGDLHVGTRRKKKQVVIIMENQKGNTSTSARSIAKKKSLQ
jgi:hypothetical protein